MRKKIYWLFFSVMVYALWYTNVYGEEEYTVRVFRVIDGGTFIATNGEKLSFFPIDVPSLDTKIKALDKVAEDAFHFLKQTIYAKEVIIRIEGRKYTRRDGSFPVLVYLKDGTLVNQQIIEQGFGSLDKEEGKGSKSLNVFLEWEQRAREQQKGVWRTSVRDLKRDGKRIPIQNTSPSNPNRRIVQ